MYFYLLRLSWAFLRLPSPSSPHVAPTISHSPSTAPHSLLCLIKRPPNSFIYFLSLPSFSTSLHIILSPPSTSSCFLDTPPSGPPSLHHFVRSSLVDWLEDCIHGYLRVCVCLCVCAAFSACTRVFDVVKGEGTTMKK